MKSSILVALFLFCAIAVTGCKNPCKDADCVNGTCSEDPDDRKEAICTCSPGYETENCSKGINAKFSGGYTASESCTATAQRSYQTELSAKTGTTNEFIIAGLYNNGLPYTVNAVIGSSGASFTIAKQDLGITGFQIEADNGSFSADAKTLTMEYVVTFRDTIPVESCTASLTRN